MENFKIVILDDHPIVAEGVQKLLSDDRRFQVETCHTLSALYAYCIKERPNLVIADYELKEGTALDLITYLNKKDIHIPVLIHTMHTEFWIIQLLVKAEVAGIVVKNDRLEEIKTATERILLDQQKHYSPTALKIVLSLIGDHSSEQNLDYKPTPRESEVIHCLSVGMTSEEIAQTLYLSKNTVDSLRKNILLKSGASNVSHLMRIAFMKGWIKQ